MSNEQKSAQPLATKFAGIITDYVNEQLQEKDRKLEILAQQMQQMQQQLQKLTQANAENDNNKEEASSLKDQEQQQDLEDDLQNQNNEKKPKLMVEMMGPNNNKKSPSFPSCFNKDEKQQNEASPSAPSLFDALDAPNRNEKKNNAEGKKDENPTLTINQQPTMNTASSNPFAGAAQPTQENQTNNNNPAVFSTSNNDNNSKNGPEEDNPFANAFKNNTSTTFSAAAFQSGQGNQTNNNPSASQTNNNNDPGKQNIFENAFKPNTSSSTNPFSGWSGGWNANQSQQQQTQSENGGGETTTLSNGQVLVLKTQDSTPKRLQGVVIVARILFPDLEDALKQHVHAMETRVHNNAKVRFTRDELKTRAFNNAREWQAPMYMYNVAQAIVNETQKGKIDHYAETKTVLVQAMIGILFHPMYTYLLVDTLAEFANEKILNETSKGNLLPLGLAKAAEDRFKALQAKYNGYHDEALLKSLKVLFSDGIPGTTKNEKKESFWKMFNEITKEADDKLLNQVCDELMLWKCSEQIVRFHVNPSAQHTYLGAVGGIGKSEWSVLIDHVDDLRVANAVHPRNFGTQDIFNFVKSAPSKIYAFLSPAEKSAIDESTKKNQNGGGNQNNKSTPNPKTKKVDVTISKMTPDQKDKKLKEFMMKESQPKYQPQHQQQRNEERNEQQNNSTSKFCKLCADNGYHLSSRKHNIEECENFRQDGTERPEEEKEELRKKRLGSRYQSNFSGKRRQRE